MNSVAANSAWNNPAPAPLDTLQARFGLRVAARLSEASESVGSDVSERLRFAREQALERARLARVPAHAAATGTVGATASGAALLGGASRWWFRLAAVVPGLALVAGLVLIEKWQANEQISAAAEIDAALLSDDLPPDAYNDPGFVEFLKTSSRQ